MTSGTLVLVMTLAMYAFGTNLRIGRERARCCPPTLELVDQPRAGRVDLEGVVALGIDFEICVPKRTLGATAYHQNHCQYQTLATQDLFRDLALGDADPQSYGGPTLASQLGMLRIASVGA